MVGIDNSEQQLATARRPQKERRTKSAAERLLRSAFDIYRMRWPGDSGIEFHPSHADWIPILRAAGFEIEG